jgi:hypothetical protein
MSRANRERVHEAQRAGLRNRLRHQRRVSQDVAEAILDGWAAEAAARGLGPDDPGYWSEGWARLVEGTG